jgi:hypothetical protein
MQNNVKTRKYPMHRKEMVIEYGIVYIQVKCKLCNNIYKANNLRDKII